MAGTARTGGEWQLALNDVLRGATGGLLFGIPLLYTMEMWWLGETAGAARVLLALLAAAVPVFVLVDTAGFRRAPGTTRFGALVDTVVALAIAFVTCAMVLLLLQRIDIGTPLPVAASMVLYQAAPFALGVAVAQDVLGRASADGERRSRDDGGPGTVADLGAAAIGAAFVALSIAPTEEIPMLTAALEGSWLALLVALSLLLSYAVVFAAGFGDEQGRREQEGVLQRPLTETVAAYVVALAVSALLLLFFDNLDVDSVPSLLAQVVVLGLPASIGGAAGRLAV